MKRNQIIFIIVVVSLTILSLFWRVHSVSGVVYDTEGRPLPGTIVRVKATDIDTETDTTGHFTFNRFEPAFRVRVTAWQDGYYIGGANAWPWDSTIEIVLAPYVASDHPDYTWLSPAIETRSPKEEWLVQTSLNLAAWISIDNVFKPLSEHLVLGCRDCHQAIYEEWNASAHSFGVKNIRFMTMYNGTDVNGVQSPLTRYAVHRDYGRIPLPPDTNQPYFGPGFKLDSPDSAGNCATCHLPTLATENSYSANPNHASGVDAEGTHCDFCHKIAAIKLDPDTGEPYKNMPGVMSIELMRPEPGSQLFFGPYDDVDFGRDTYLPEMKQSEICAACHFASFWGTPIYQSFVEWQTSSYPAEGKNCQSCHMQPNDVVTNFAPGRGGVERNPDTIPTHRFLGVDEILLQNTTEMTVTTRREDSQFIVTVSVTNARAGHHIPTDSPLRQIFLVVTATDKQGRSLPLQGGPTLPDWAGDLAGLPGIYFAKILEQLWTGITPTGAYWTPTRVVEDTRLPARATNTSRYIFTAPSNDPITVEARLIFRRAYYELVQQKDWDTPDILMKSITVVAP